MRLLEHGTVWNGEGHCICNSLGTCEGRALAQTWLSDLLTSKAARPGVGEWGNPPSTPPPGCGKIVLRNSGLVPAMKAFVIGVLWVLIRCVLHHNHLFRYDDVCLSNFSDS